MTTHTVRPGSEEEWQRVWRWRAARLRNAGFAEAPADVLARDRAVDVHALLELVDRGCPPPLAARIMAPLEREEEDG